jgi:hypothetical protein
VSAAHRFVSPLDTSASNADARDRSNIGENAGFSCLVCVASLTKKKATDYNNAPSNSW